MRLRGVALYGAVTLPFLLAPVPLAWIGIPYDVGLSLALIASVLAGDVATFWINAQYVASLEPRSGIFGMLRSALLIKAAFGTWIAYLIAANLLARIGVLLPTPDPMVRALLNANLAVVFLASQLYYAVAIRLIRWDEDTEAQAVRDVLAEREL